MLFNKRSTINKGCKVIRHINRVSSWALTIGFSFGLSTFALADSVTFDFSGTITQAIGDFAAGGSTPVGSAIDGSFTINLGVADPALSSGSLGDMTNDSASQVGNGGGVGVGTGALPVPSALVFMSSFTTNGGVSFGSLPSATSAYGIVQTTGSSSGGNLQFTASDRYTLADGSTIGSGLDILGPTAFDPSGIPIFGGSNIATGTFVTAGNSVNGGFKYSIDSVSSAAVAAPEIDTAASAASALTLLVGMIVVIGGRNTRNSAESSDSHAG